MSGPRASVAAAAELRETRARLGAAVTSLRGRLAPAALREQAAAAAKGAVKAGWERVRGRLRRHPVAPVAVVFALGLLLGIAARRR